MCGRVEHYVAAAGHGAVGSLLLFGALPDGAIDSLHPVARVAATVVLAAGAVPMSAGKHSPDIDQFKDPWDRLDNMVPDELLGFGGPMRHRGISHWWGIPAVVSFAVWWVCHQVPLPVAVVIVLAAWVPLAGVWSHLLSDFVVGARYGGGKRPEADDPGGAWNAKSALDADDSPRGPGIPLMPWWCHVGLGYKVGSLGEWVYVLGMVGAGVLAVIGSWHGLAVQLPTAVWAVLLVGLLAAGLEGRRRTARRAGRASNLNGARS